MPDQYKNSSDHDILITLVEKTMNNHTTQMDNISRLGTEISSLRHATNSSLQSMELRLATLERVVDARVMQNIKDKIEANTQWINEFRVTWKTIVGVSAAISAIITFIITILSSYLKM